MSLRAPAKATCSQNSVVHQEQPAETAEVMENPSESVNTGSGRARISSADRMAEASYAAGAVPMKIRQQKDFSEGL